ncbi:hypothetical protein QYF61_015166 [Mycteria americana]|uniref:Uncharacterized protein n=1 Tax=Mycteria americana TaxID=33587 RepID=A0AAN7N9C7_MYCAM|nr:hypothetical protein QYF61_015165 [Mycteria americana]KAK4822419.1 hypothetical protein QYF61_015166 [Mycteria americana]
MPPSSQFLIHRTSIHIAPIRERGVVGDRAKGITEVQIDDIRTEVRLTGVFHWTMLLKGPANLTLNTSRDGASTPSLGNLLQCLTTLETRGSSLSLPLCATCPGPSPSRRPCSGPHSPRISVFPGLGRPGGDRGVQMQSPKYQTREEESIFTGKGTGDRKEGLTPPMAIINTVVVDAGRWNG